MEQRMEDKMETGTIYVVVQEGSLCLSLLICLSQHAKNLFPPAALNPKP